MPSVLEATRDNQARLKSAKTERANIVSTDVVFVQSSTEMNSGFTLTGVLDSTGGFHAVVQLGSRSSLNVNGSTVPRLQTEVNFVVEPLEPNPERARFLRMRDQLKDQYEGRYVAIHEGRVVDSDPDAAAVLDRFCEMFGEEVSVYFGFVGEEPGVIVPGVDSIP